MMLWLYAQPWFLDTHLLGTNLRELFQVRPYNLSVAVWVGFLALFGIATDDGVIMATRIDQTMAEEKPDSIEAIRKAVVDGGRLRIRAAVMTSATTILALLPVLTSTGRGSDIMVPMAIPSFGGMVVASMTWFVVPILYCWVAEWRFRLASLAQHNTVPTSQGVAS
jgi:Cu(I)/Ag(I) efflux system membrane protein CusA/SilA